MRIFTSSMHLKDKIKYFEKTLVLSMLSEADLQYLHGEKNFSQIDLESAQRICQAAVNISTEIKIKYKKNKKHLNKALWKYVANVNTILKIFDDIKKDKISFKNCKYLRRFS